MCKENGRGGGMGRREQSRKDAAGGCRYVCNRGKRATCLTSIFFDAGKMLKLGLHSWQSAPIIEETISQTQGIMQGSNPCPLPTIKEEA